MNQETIRKVLELTHTHYDAKREYDQMKELLDDLYNHNYSNKGLVHGFLDGLNGSIICSRISQGDLDAFYSHVFVAIEKAWIDLCNKQKAIVERIDKELEAL